MLKSLKAGHKEAMYQLARRYLDGAELPKNQEKKEK